MRRFKIGDKARLVFTRSSHHPGWVKGAIVVIEYYVDTLPNGEGADYEVKLEGDDHYGYVLDEQLEPITKQELGSWDEMEKLGWNPIKEKENNA